MGMSTAYVSPEDGNRKWPLECRSGASWTSKRGLGRWARLFLLWLSRSRAGLGPLHDDEAHVPFQPRPVKGAFEVPDELEEGLKALEELVKGTSQPTEASRPATGGPAVLSEQAVLLAAGEDSAGSSGRSSLKLIRTIRASKGTIILL